MGKRLHIYKSADLIRSVRESVEVTAECGLRKTITRADVDAAVDSDRQGCRKCLEVVTKLTKTQDVTISKRGWDAVTRPARTYYMTIKVGANTTWNYSNDWPIAG